MITRRGLMHEAKAQKSVLATLKAVDIEKLVGRRNRGAWAMEIVECKVHGLQQHLRSAMTLPITGSRIGILRFVEVLHT